MKRKPDQSPPTLEDGFQAFYDEEAPFFIEGLDNAEEYGEDVDEG